jgi:2-polyprenyl-6-methoxyphenol hydroxylase-like FAD-dependent oxidoreductase
VTDHLSVLAGLQIDLTATATATAGMNTGIADAYDCATRIAAVVSGRADESLLEGYEEYRRPAAQEVLRFTDRMTQMAMLSNPAARLVRRVSANTVGRLGVVQRRMTGG